MSHWKHLPLWRPTAGPHNEDLARQIDAAESGLAIAMAASRYE